MKLAALLGLASLAMAEDYQFWSGNRCTGSRITAGNLACGKNRLPNYPAIHGVRLLHANGLRAEFYERKTCDGDPWFVDDGTGGCITDIQARTGCIKVQCG